MFDEEPRPPLLDRIIFAFQRAFDGGLARIEWIVHVLMAGPVRLAHIAARVLEFFAYIAEITWERLFSRVVASGESKAVQELSSWPAKFVWLVRRSIEPAWQLYLTIEYRIAGRIPALVRSRITEKLEPLLEFIFTWFDGAIAWFSTRNYIRLVLGLPAMALVIPLVFCGLKIPFYTRGAKAAHYRQAIDIAISTGDQETASLLYRKLAKLGGINTNTEYRSALAIADDGDWITAYDRMKTLAPLDHGPGLDAAHFWIVAAFVQGHLAPPQLTRDHVVQHIESLQQLLPNNVKVALLASRAYERLGELSSAIEVLQPMSKDTLIATRLAEVGFRYGDSDRAKSQLGELQGRFRRKKQEQGSLTVDDYIDWARVHEVAGELHYVIEVLEDGFKQHTDVEVLREMLARAILSQHDTLPGTRSDQKLALLRRALEIKPSSDILQRVAVLTELEGPVGDGAVELIATHNDPDLMNLAVELTLGSAAAMRNDLTAARHYYTRAAERDSESAIALNNLAWIVAHHEPVDVDESLRLANEAVRLAPNHPRFRDTRGQVLAKVGRWEEAEKDLEFAINGMPKNIDTRRALARVYQKQGKDELAVAHRRSADAMAIGNSAGGGKDMEPAK